MSYLCIVIQLTSLDCTNDTMVTQQAISARISHEIMWSMAQETMVSGTPRNRMLNEGARLWLDLVDVRRQIRCFDQHDIQRKIAIGWLLKWFPEAKDVLT